MLFKLFKNGFFGNLLDREQGGLLEQVINNNSSDKTVDTSTFFICIAAALILGFIISLIYMFANRKTGFAQSYVLTMIILPGIIALILLLVKTTYGALSLAGVLMLVRFRNVPGDPKDISYIFFTMAAGVACGLGCVGYGAIFVLMLGIILIILDFFNFGLYDELTLKITIPENLDYKGVFDPVLENYTQYYKLRRVRTMDFGMLFEIIYSIRTKTDLDHKKFIDELRTLNGNLNINLIMFKYDDKVYEGGGSYV